MPVNRCPKQLFEAQLYTFWGLLLAVASKVRLMLEQHSFELCGSVYMQIVFNKYIEKFWRFVTV